MTPKSHVQLPLHLKRSSLVDFYNHLDENLNTPDACLDFSTVRYVFPMSILVAGTHIRNWAQGRKNQGLKTYYTGQNSTSPAVSYLKHLGFFDFIGIKNVGNLVGSAYGSSTYVPIRKILRPSGYSKDEFDIKKAYGQVQDEASKIATVLAGCDENAEDHKLCRYALREVFRNVFEHSQADHCYVCAQRWADGRSQIAIADEGIGVLSSLKTTYEINSDDEALTLAIKPGVSRIIQDRDNIYDNSGFGLYILSEFGGSFGWFCLGSGEKTLMKSPTKVHHMNLPFKGTFVGLNIDFTPKSFIGTLHDITTSGEEEAIQEGRTISISKQSPSFRLI